MEITFMDDRGRITLGKRLGEKYGTVFMIVQGYNEIILRPKPKDPLERLRNVGKKAGIGHLSARQIEEIAEEEAYKEISKRLKK